MTFDQFVTEYGESMRVALWVAAGISIGMCLGLFISPYGRSGAIRREAHKVWDGLSAKQIQQEREIGLMTAITNINHLVEDTVDKFTAEQIDAILIATLAVSPEFIKTEVSRRTDNAGGPIQESADRIRRAVSSLTRRETKPAGEQVSGVQGGDASGQA